MSLRYTELRLDPSPATAQGRRVRHRRVPNRSARSTRQSPHSQTILAHAITIPDRGGASVITSSKPAKRREAEFGTLRSAKPSVE
jgi:hypothetical protein